jgi:hypothetical protein
MEFEVNKSILSLLRKARGARRSPTVERTLKISVREFVKIVIGVAAGLAALAPAAVHAASSSVFLLREKSVAASFFSTHASGCIVKSAFLLASESRTRERPGGSATSGPVATVDVAGFDTCNGALLYSAFGETDMIDLAINTFLRTARLRTSIEVLDSVTFLPFTVQIDVTWASTGPLDFGTEHSITPMPGALVSSNFTHWSRTAVATGIVTDGIQNHIPAPSVEAQIQRILVGEVTIQH